MSPLPSEDRRALLALARQAITAAVAHQAFPPLPQLRSDPGRRGAFVTLHQKGRLRGCIGMMDSAGPLPEMVGRCAVSAAMEDPRFAPLTAGELDGLEVEISVLSPLRKVSPEEVEVGTHGLRVRQGFLSGVLLPQVASRYNWSRERFLEEACRKATLPPDAWRESNTVIEAFTAEVFSDADPLAESKMPAD